MKTIRNFSYFGLFSVNFCFCVNRRVKYVGGSGNEYDAIIPLSVNTVWI